MFSKKKRLNYLNFRENALKMKPEQMKMNIEKSNVVYSVLVDCFVDNDVVTLRCNLNGSVSRYRPSLKNDIGLGQKFQDISELGIELCAKCTNVLSSFNIVKKDEMFLMDPTADKNYHLYLLTTKGVYGHIFDLSKMDCEKKEMITIFEMIDKIMTLSNEK
jgi:hypothetical protein